MTVLLNTLSQTELIKHVQATLAVMRTYIDDVITDKSIDYWSREDLEYFLVNYGESALKTTFLD